MTLKQRYDGVIEWFSANMPSAGSELHYENPYQLLVAVMLSAQCTDKRVNMTTPALFAAFPTPQALASASAEQIYPYIRSISYPNNKARNLAAMARMLCAEFGGEVPNDLEALQRLPGVGRKTANVVGAVIWNREVMPVDTHVFRVSARIGLSRGARTPLQTELQLEKNIPHHLLPVAHHWLILHGRYVCTARAPHCDTCGIASWCRYHAEAAKRAAEKTTKKGTEQGAEKTSKKVVEKTSKNVAVETAEKDTKRAAVTAKQKKEASGAAVKQ